MFLILFVVLVAGRLLGCVAFHVAGGVDLLLRGTTARTRGLVLSRQVVLAISIERATTWVQADDGSWTRK